ncbi:phosphotransferase [Thalassotalea marina]|uniref:Protein LicA n=1 Tax=Thalassotalea marina TaxID=1673741 RepID=A0A919BDB4_9GAMM|nr:phosphotransferase [Thalassotalea marina]GHF81700.1 protein LicA [Thalassotalea marina]
MRTLTDIQKALDVLNVNLSASSMTLLAQGFSSDNYLVSANGQQYVLKFAHQPLITSQIAIQPKLHELAITPEVLATEPAKGLQLSQYWPSKTPCTAEQLPAIGELLSRLHQIKHNSACMDFQQKFNQYQGLAEFAIHRPVIEVLKAKLSAFDKHLGFCHNDLVLDNMLQCDNEVKLIDFEYSGNNDVFFDLASVSSSLLLGTEDKARLLTYYLAHCKLTITNELAVKKLNCFQLAYDFLCYFWYIEHQQPRLAKQVLTQLISPKLNLAKQSDN